MFHDAFVMAAHNLAANADFYSLIAEGRKPDASITRLQAKENSDEARRRFDPNEPITIPAQKLSRQPFAKTAQEGRKVAVKLEKFGHGSGFFISPQGHILTNAHVVGDALRTRVITADKEHSLVAEVLRVDKPRDVAVLKLEEIPPDMHIHTLPLRTDWPDVGEDVYAIGAPQDRRKLADTVTKGIVSAHRKAFMMAGHRQNYIQADLGVHPGNSGGPLLDEKGNIVGLSVAGYYEAPSNYGVGLSFFVPIAEALDALDIDMGGGGPIRLDSQP
jgi:S1-C subfamily serine protease